MFAELFCGYVVIGGIASLIKDKMETWNMSPDEYYAWCCKQKGEALVF